MHIICTFSTHKICSILLESIHTTVAILKLKSRIQEAFCIISIWSHNRLLAVNITDVTPLTLMPVCLRTMYT